MIHLPFQFLITLILYSVISLQHCYSTEWPLCADVVPYRATLSVIHWLVISVMFHI